MKNNEIILIQIDIFWKKMNLFTLPSANQFSITHNF